MDDNNRNINPEALEFKTLMSACLDRYLDENLSESKKTVAGKLGASRADLSHWISLQTNFTIPSHKLPLFCRIVGSNALLWHVQDKYEAAS